MTSNYFLNNSIRFNVEFIQNPSTKLEHSLEKKFNDVETDANLALIHKIFNRALILAM